MILELGDTCIAVNEKTGLSCSVEFKTKVWTNWHAFDHGQIVLTGLFFWNL